MIYRKKYPEGYTHNLHNTKITFTVSEKRAKEICDKYNKILDEYWLEQLPDNLPIDKETCLMILKGRGLNEVPVSEY